MIKGPTITAEFPFAPAFTAPRLPTAAERFQAFHEANPHILTTIVEKALQLKRAGRKHYGCKAIFESMRFDHDMDTTSTDEWKLNNNWTAHYARLAMGTEPTLKGFFLLRTQRGEGGNNGKF
jgi:hypothetical protein